MKLEWWKWNWSEEEPSIQRPLLHVVALYVDSCRSRLRCQCGSCSNCMDFYAFLCKPLFSKGRNCVGVVGSGQYAASDLLPEALVARHGAGKDAFKSSHQLCALWPSTDHHASHLGLLPGFAVGEACALETNKNTTSSEMFWCSETCALCCK